jgi:hypothetical protein
MTFDILETNGEDQGENIQDFALGEADLSENHS